MCRLNHPLAANGTMSWPDFGVQRSDGALPQDVPSPRRNHPMAETAESEASDGRDRVMARIYRHDKRVD
jgi:hypothetical protein